MITEIIDRVTIDDIGNSADITVEDLEEYCQIATEAMQREYPDVETVLVIPATDNVGLTVETDDDDSFEGQEAREAAYLEVSEFTADNWMNWFPTEAGA
jgi:hypothetical protein